MLTNKCNGIVSTALRLLAICFAGAMLPPVAFAQAPAYVARGDSTEQKYNAHREKLDAFYHRLVDLFNKEAPDLRQKLEAPAPVPYGYQILPALTDPAPAPKQTRIRFSPFSWPRTDSVIARGRDSLTMIENRLDSVMRLSDSAERHRGYESIASVYRSRVAGQKFMSSLIQYNRLWQGEIARLPDQYKESNSLRDAAVARQSLLDSIATRDSAFKSTRQRRIDSLTRKLADAMRKFPAPSYARVEKQSDHRWLVTVPLYTDIADTAFVAKARVMIENAWHVSEGGDDYALELDVRSISPAQLYGSSPAPAPGAHIDVPAHINRFPKDGAVLTTGGNNTYAYSNAIVVGPGTLPRSTLVHEFGHMMGFRDNYFRASEDRGADGYAITEVILESESVLTTPENGRVLRGHFESLIHQ